MARYVECCLVEVGTDSDYRSVLIFSIPLFFHTLQKEYPGSCKYFCGAFFSVDQTCLCDSRFCDFPDIKCCDDLEERCLA